ncbi:hypothetical protein KQI63_09715 [bacterium]|nr:hypothetical protein [bacterium]
MGFSSRKWRVKVKGGGVIANVIFDNPIDKPAMTYCDCPDWTPDKDCVHVEALKQGKEKVIVGGDPPEHLHVMLGRMKYKESLEEPAADSPETSGSEDSPDL